MNLPSQDSLELLKDELHVLSFVHEVFEILVVDESLGVSNTTSSLDFISYAP